MAINHIILSALREDIGRGDITTRVLFPVPLKIAADIIAKEAGVVCGVGVAEAVFRLAGKRGSLKVYKKVKDGAKIKKGQVICRIEGDARAILTGERVALNFLSRLSGIATLTRRYVEKIKPCKTKILDTRKTTPGLRELEKYAVRCGGGTNHRMGLWDMALVKDNHIAVHSPRHQRFGGQAQSMVHGKEKLKEIVEKIKKRTNKKVEIEIENIKQFKEVMKTYPDIVMLDNMSLKNIKKAVTLKKKLSTMDRRLSTKLEVSGGVTLDNVRQIAATGVDMISIGALTHSAKAIDFSLEVLG